MDSLSYFGFHSVVLDQLLAQLHFGVYRRSLFRIFSCYLSPRGLHLFLPTSAKVGENKNHVQRGQRALEILFPTLLHHLRKSFASTLPTRHFKTKVGYLGQQFYSICVRVCWGLGGAEFLSSLTFAPVTSPTTACTSLQLLVNPS